MSDIRYNLSALFQAAFGVNIPVYLPYPFYANPQSSIAFDGVNDNTQPDNSISFSGIGDNNQPAPDITFTGVTPITEQEAQRMSWMGTPILFPIRFKEGSYSVYQANGDIEKIDKQEVFLPASTIVDFNRYKKITKTQVLGDTGTVKELFSLEDWRIRIRGFCLNEPGRPAYEQIMELLEWEKLADSIAVGGSLFEDKGIYQIVIENMEVRQLDGQPGVIPFTIQALSDKPLELTAV